MKKITNPLIEAAVSQLNWMTQNKSLSESVDVELKSPDAPERVWNSTAFLNSLQQKLSQLKWNDNLHVRFSDNPRDPYLHITVVDTGEGAGDQYHASWQQGGVSVTLRAKTPEPDTLDPKKFTQWLSTSVLKYWPEMVSKPTPRKSYINYGGDEDHGVPVVYDTKGNRMQDF